MNEEELKEMLENSNALFYGELERCLDDYLKKFFSVEIKDIGFDTEHPLHDTTFWLVVSWLNSMHCVTYGTSPRGAWLTEKGIALKKWVLENEEPVSKLISMERS